MNREEIELSIGAKVRINASGDLQMEPQFRLFVQEKDRWMRIVKLTRGGMVYLYGDDAKFYTVPPKNVDMFHEYNCSDFYEAYWWLYEHPFFQYEVPQIKTFKYSFFEHALDLEIVKVNPKNSTIEDDRSLNTKTEVWIEVASDYNNEYNYCSTHEWYLDCGGDTFEAAVLRLAENVYKYYKNGKELLIDPME